MASSSWLTITIVVPMPDLPEACPLNLAPTTSTSMMLALGTAFRGLMTALLWWPVVAVGILLTAAQSLLAVVMLASLRFSVCSALLLFTLFAGQFVIPELVAAVPPLAERFSPSAVHPFFSALYIALAAGFFLRRPRAVLEMIHGMHR